MPTRDPLNCSLLALLILNPKHVTRHRTRPSWFRFGSAKAAKFKSSVGLLEKKKKQHWKRIKMLAALAILRIDPGSTHNGVVGKLRSRSASGRYRYWQDRRVPSLPRFTTRFKTMIVTASYDIRLCYDFGYKSPLVAFASWCITCINEPN